MSTLEKRSKAIDLSHHLSLVSRQRTANPLGVIHEKYTGRKDLVNLDSGVPPTEAYPYDVLSATYLLNDAFPLHPKDTPSGSSGGGLLAWFSSLFGGATTTLSVPRWPAPDEPYSLASALAYSPSNGLAPLREFIRMFAGRVYRPAYSDWQTLIDVGSTDGWSKALELLLERGEGFLCDEWTYSGALLQSLARDARPVPIKIDSVGLLATDLEKVLSEWDEKARGFKRPRVLYQVTVGQNPTGTTLTAQRKKEIYDIAVKYDVIIIEDDPYYFQQFSSYQVQESRSVKEQSDEQWVKSLVPSFLQFDHQGRVIRLDTFSKTIGPGSRLGFITCCPTFYYRLLWASEATTASACGVGQAVIGSLLHKWGYDGYVRWLRGLNGQYELRRDWILDLIFKHFDVAEDKAKGVFVVYRKKSSKEVVMAEKSALSQRKVLFEFVPPSAGMFVWLKIHVYNHRQYSPSDRSTTEVLMETLWTTLAESGVLTRGGKYFQANKEADARYGNLRLSYSNVEYDPMVRAMNTFTKVINEFFD